LLNQNKKLLSLLKEKSKYISIIAGSLYQKNNIYHNSTYFFDDQQMQIAHKVVLIPFGEAVPLPEKLRHFINDIFYNGAKDYDSAEVATDFVIKGITFRNAICYEATTDKIFQDMKGKYMIAISNNAWFTPSIQPVLQKLLLKYYALKYDVKIFSVSNMSDNSVIN
jgi:apolipoprotein N-acyltransferase